MSLRVISFVLKVIRFILVVLLLGLGVHFGFFRPRGDYSADYAGILGSSYVIVLQGTLLLYFLYRVAVIIVKIALARWKKPIEKNYKHKDRNSEKDDIFNNEVLLLILVMFPIFIGNVWIRAAVDLSNGVVIQILRFVMALAILTSLGVLYRENMDFSKAE